jgi:hypothetical protein
MSLERDGVQCEFELRFSELSLAHGKDLGTSKRPDLGPIPRRQVRVPPRPVRLAAAGLALDRGPLALALRDVRADRLRGGWRESDELQAGADGGEVVAGESVDFALPGYRRKLITSILSDLTVVIRWKALV